MILIAIAWLLVVAIALYQSMYGLFSAVIMAILTTICAICALGSYEWLGTEFLYVSQPAYADGLSLILHFVIPLLILRIVFDKLIAGNAPLGGWADRAAGGLVGLYIGTVMVGILAIVLQMLPWGGGGSVMGYEPFDRSLQRADRLYCDEFALGLFQSASSLASDQPFDQIHDNLLLELFCARNTSGANGRVDAQGNALEVTESFLPGKTWEQVTDHETLPKDPRRADLKSDVLIAWVRVSAKVRGEDNWYRLPLTHFRLVTGSGMSLYPVGFLVPREGKWAVGRPENTDEDVKIADMRIFVKDSGDPNTEICLVYRLPKPATEDVGIDSSDDMDSEDAKLIKDEQIRKHAPDYMVFRRTARSIVPDPTPNLLPELPEVTTQPAKKTKKKPTKPKPRS